MALHGQICVNELPIVRWAAVRQEHPPGEENTYEVTIKYRDPEGFLHEAKGKIRHKFGDGALVLTREVMDFAADHIYPRSEPDS